ncbi:MAG: DNA polymerase III subunit alpha, partial [Paludibacteraceae bacterium]|nr:DNA polymerase III subunit alpha [Paludibacteraceae bacterium]
MKSFVHLHVHSYYSMLDGMSSISGLIDKAQADGMPAIALTDHGSMFGIKEFYDYAKKKNNGIKKTISEKEIALTTATDEAEKTKLLQEIAKLQKSHIKPILGSEVYVAKRTRFDKSEDIDRSGSHLVILAKNKQGYKNLCKIVSYGYIEGFYYRPRIDKDLLEKYSEGLIVTSACLGGEIHRLVGRGDIEGAEKSILWFKKIFGDDYYLELQRHKTDKPGADTHVFEKQERQNEVLIALARKTNTKLIASNDVHFVEEEHAEAHDRLICLSTGKDLEDEKRMRYSKQEWLKTSAQMNAIFADIPEAIENTIELANKVEYYSIESNPIMPAFSIPSEFGSEAAYREKYTHEDLKKEFTYDEHGNKVLSDKEANEKIEKLGGVDGLYRVKLEADYLRKITFEGTANRYGEELSPDIRERIEFELHIMKTMGFPGYFLIVQDLIQAARDMGVSVGPGRGSAAGSVVAYCLKITDIDPLKYDLLFERFLNPDRISMPDIDIDFDDDGRGKVLEYVTEKYGKEHVAQIATYGTMATKMAIKDVARVQKLPLSESDRLTKLIPNSFPEEKGKSPKVNITNCIERIPELKEARYSADSRLSDTLKYAEMLEGTVRQVGIHACGVIIGADDLTNFVPLCTDKNNPETLVTQYEGSSIETIGLIKMDFLGLKTLSIINETLRNIKASKGITVEIESIPIDDAKTYELYSKGLTTGTFQFESAGMQKYLRDLKPNRFEDLIAMNALYRPGPMAYIPSFVNRKHGIEEIEYDFPIMKDRLHDTYGITVYQEQVMLLSRDLAGFTRGESDELRKAMGKKLIDKMEALKVKFINGATKNGYGPEEKLEKIWKDWAEFAKYAFNKSHATCYSWISYQTAYLKANYTADFMAANLTRNKDNITDITKFMEECKQLGINVLGPNVNESSMNFISNKADDIRFGLGGVKGVGGGAVEAIVAEREANGRYTSVFNFLERVNLNACNKKAIESLALSGAFDEFDDVKREAFFAENSKGEVVLEALIRYANKYQLDKQTMENSLFGGVDAVDIQRPEIPMVADWSQLYKLTREKDMIGIYLSAHPLDPYEIELACLCNETLSNLRDVNSLKDKFGANPIRVAGIITKVNNLLTKNNMPYGRFAVEDYSGTHEFVLFGKQYTELDSLLRENYYVFIQGIVQERRADYKYTPKPEDEAKSRELVFKINTIELLEGVKEKGIDKLKISIPLVHITEELTTELYTMLELDKTEKGKTL